MLSTNGGALAVQMWLPSHQRSLVAVYLSVGVYYPPFVVASCCIPVWPGLMAGGTQQLVEPVWRCCGLWLVFPFASCIVHLAVSLSTLQAAARLHTSPQLLLLLLQTHAEWLINRASAFFLCRMICNRTPPVGRHFRLRSSQSWTGLSLLSTLAALRGWIAE